MVTYGLFTCREAGKDDANTEVWWGGPNFPNHTADEEERFTHYPVEVFLNCVDHLNGDGWSRRFVEEHAEILDTFWCNTGPGHDNYAVRALVKSEADLLALLDKCELFESEPKPL